MRGNKKVVPPNYLRETKSITPKITPNRESSTLTVTFEKFNLNPICITGRFNNHFKDTDHFSAVVAGFIGKILPKITSHTYKEICEGSQEGRILHFHTIDQTHQELVTDILKEYGFSSQVIEQMSEGNDLFNFSATLGHTYAARIICHKVENILYLLFLDTNHHIYFNEKYTEESLFYETCPVYIAKTCEYMPTDCFAVSYLDEQKYKESIGYTECPPIN